MNGNVVGMIGGIAPAVAAAVDLRGDVFVAEFDLPALLAGAQTVPQLSPLPKYPAVRRDLSLIVGERTPFESIRALVADRKIQHLEDLEYVTTYRGKPLAAGQKSVTITLIFVHRARP